MADFPTTVAPADITITSLHQSYMQISQNLNVYRTDRGGHRWKLSLDFPPMRHDAFKTIFSFLVSQRGKFGRFEFQLPIDYNSNPNKSGITTSTAIDSGRSIEMTGFTQNDEAFKIGDFFNFSGHLKTYMITGGTLIADSNGKVTPTFEPHIHQAVVIGETVNMNPKFSVANENDEVVGDYNSAKIFGLNINLFEVLQ